MLPEDRMAVATPEGVTLEFSLAGVGSRFVAALLDALVQLGLLIAVLLLSLALQNVAGGWAQALGAVLSFLVLVGYDVAFETLASGRTLGKRWTGLRVVRLSGAPVTFRVSLVRNLLRLVDLMPGSYLVGIITILVTPRNQRLGDLAAGTVVVRERTASAAVGGVGFGATTIDSSTWDVSLVTAEEVAAAREFLARRTALTSEARARVGRELASRLRPKVAGPDLATIGPEAFLEALVAAKSAR